MSSSADASIASDSKRRYGLDLLSPGPPGAAHIGFAALEPASGWSGGANPASSFIIYRQAFFNFPMVTTQGSV